MARLACPVAEVEEELAPYIHTRQETHRIRQAIAHHLSTLADHPANNIGILSCASPYLTLGDEPGPIDGLHKRYYDALRANVAARESYQQAKQELENLRSERVQELAARQKGGSQSSVQAYVALQRQRQQHAKLDIIQDTLAKLTDQAPRTMHDELGAIVREEVGEAPDAPKSSLSSAGSSAAVNELVFSLKRELLLAKHAYERSASSARNGHTNGHSTSQPNTAAQVQALRAARDQLISWIEGELAKISEEEGEGDESILDSDVNETASPPSEAEMITHVQHLYGDYVDARRNLVHSIDAALIATEKAGAQSKAPASSANSVPSRRKPEPSDNITYSDLITCMPTLVQTARTERALIQQASYLRRQLNAASEETKAVVQRLAGESYLVTPDAGSMKAWAVAAAAKADDTDAFVAEQTNAGRACMDATMDRLGRLEVRGRAMGELKGEL